MRPRRRVGEILVAEGVLEPVDLAEALDRQTDGERLGETVVRLGMVTPDEVVAALASQLSIDVFDPTMRPTPDALGLVSSALATAEDVLPLRLDGGRLDVAMVDPTNLVLHDDLLWRTGARRLRPLAALTDDLRAAVDRAYGLPARAPTKPETAARRRTTPRGPGLPPPRRTEGPDPADQLLAEALGETAATAPPRAAAPERRWRPVVRVTATG